ncbi:hypothetical protein HDU76_011851 [Blyttiomyces sp. JEL0837]|nr:hypothetical protein HDU76_011851 [Blyttiomyces sp. JEL0837]
MKSNRLHRGLYFFSLYQASNVEAAGVATIGGTEACNSSNTANFPFDFVFSLCEAIRAWIVDLNPASAIDGEVDNVDVDSAGSDVESVSVKALIAAQLTGASDSKTALSGGASTSF